MRSAMGSGTSTLARYSSEGWTNGSSESRTTKDGGSGETCYPCPRTDLLPMSPTAHSSSLARLNRCTLGGIHQLLVRPIQPDVAVKTFRCPPVVKPAYLETPVPAARAARISESEGNDCYRNQPCGS